MAEQRAEVEAITAARAAVVRGHVVALERSGATLRRVSAVFLDPVELDTAPGIRAIEAEVAPLLAAHSDAITLDPALFARIDALHAGAANASASTPEALRLLERRHRDVGPRRRPARSRRPGAAAGAERASSPRWPRSSATGCWPRPTPRRSSSTTPPDLAGLRADAVGRRGRGRYATVATTAPTCSPSSCRPSSRCSPRSPTATLRERVSPRVAARGARGGAHDTRELVCRIAALRAERARLLGYPHHASYVVAGHTAGTRRGGRGDAAPSWCRPPWPTRAPRPTTCAEAAGHADRAAGTGRSTPSRSDASGTTSTRPRCAPTSSSSGSCATGSSTPPSRLYGLRFVERHDLPRLPPRRADVRGARRRRAAGPVRRRPLRARRPSAAARG